MSATLMIPKNEAEPDTKGFRDDESDCEDPVSLLLTRPSDAQPGDLVQWWSHGQVRAHLDVDLRTLKDRMRETPPRIESPWINIGTTQKPAIAGKQPKSIAGGLR